jgi:folate-binding protein YgfZ
VSRSASELLLYQGVQAPFTGWTLVSVSGRHAERFLHSQLTSDVGSLAVRSSQQTALLDRGGRLQAFGILCRRNRRFELLLPTEIAEPTARLLEEHIIADDVTLEVLETPAMTLCLGAEAVRLAAEQPEDRLPVDLFGSRGFVTWEDVDLDLPLMDADELEARRVLTGWPRWGADVDPGMLIHETTLIGSAVSFDKGCYLGQETVAKVASGRGAARAPMLLEVIDGEDTIENLVGATFESDLAKKSGTVKAMFGWNGTAFLFAAVARELRVEDREVECRFDEGATVSVRTHSLPYLEAPTPEDWSRQLELKAVEAFAADREDEAIELYERATAVFPAYADAYEGLGVIYGRHGRHQEAIDLMHRLLEVDPDSVMAHTNLSLFFNQQGKIEDAEREAAEAMRAQVRRENEQRDISNVEREQADTVQADRERRAEMFRQVLELDPDDALGNFGLGELLVEQGRFGDALAHLERALTADPRYSAALLALGRAHEGSEDLAAARETYRRGIDVAAARGDLATANKMQERLAELETRARGS